MHSPKTLKLNPFPFSFLFKEVPLKASFRICENYANNVLYQNCALKCTSYWGREGGLKSLVFFFKPLAVVIVCTQIGHQKVITPKYAASSLQPIHNLKDY